MLPNNAVSIGTRCSAEWQSVLRSLMSFHLRSERCRPQRVRQATVLPPPAGRWEPLTSVARRVARPALFRCFDEGRQTQPMDVSKMTSRALLQTYARILTELVERGVTRTRNAPVGDIAEYLVRIAYDGELAPPSEKSWDVLGPDGRKIQVKCRLVVPGSKATQQYSPFRSWDFDICVFVTFDAFTYDVLQAIEVPSEGIQALAAPVPHVGATAARVNTRTNFSKLPGTTDVTTRLRHALAHLD